MGRCIVYTGFGLLLLIRPFYFSFFFLSNCQTLRFFVTLFSGTVSPRRLKLGTHMDKGQMYCVYRNQAAVAYWSLYFVFIFISFHYFQTSKCFVTVFSGTVRSRTLKLGTHMDSGNIYRVYRNQAAAAYTSLYFSFLFLSNFQTIKVFVTLFSGTVSPRRLKLCTHMDKGQLYCVYWNQAAAAYWSLYFVFIFLSFHYFQTLKCFVTVFSGTVRSRTLKLDTHMDSGHIYRVYRNQAAAAYTSLYFSFFFLSNFQILKVFVTLFSGTVSPRSLKLGTHMDKRQLYCVYWNQAAAAYWSLYFVFIFLSFHYFQTLKCFVTVFSGTVRSRTLKLDTHMDSGHIYRVYRNQAAAAYTSLYFSFFFLSNFQILKVFVTLFSGTVRPRRLKLGTCTHVDNGLMYRVYRNQGAPAYSSLYFFIFLSFQFSNIEIFRQTFLRNCEA